MEAISKTSDSRGSKRNLIEVENNVKLSLTSNQKASSVVLRWLFLFAVTCFTLFFIAIVIKQEYDIRTIKLQMESSVENNGNVQNRNNMHVNNNKNLDEPVKNGDHKDVLNGTHSRGRRQIHLSDSQLEMLPFAHLSGSRATTGANSNPRDVPYHWTNWTMSSPLNTGYALVQMHKTSQGVVQAIRIVCSGWYYVYSQIPYMWKPDQDINIGHSIVKIEKCGQERPVTVLQTEAHHNYVNRPTKLISEDWRYVGGIVYLSAATYVEVRCLKHSSCNITTGGFFGLFLIQHSEGSCFAQCAS